MAELQKYTGGCHCGKVRYEVELKLDGAVECNCSICGRTGAKMVFVPKDKFKLQSGEAALTDYQFNKKVVHHKFCSTCGVRSFSHGVGPGGAEMVSVNARCLDGVDPWALKITQYDGKNH